MSPKKTMQAAYLEGPEQISVREVPRPEPGPGEVLMAVESVGIGGLDLQYYLHGRVGGQGVEAPFVLGHECAGRVEKPGEGVKSPKKGERVTLEPCMPCGRCAECRQGRYNLCPEGRFPGSPPVDGVYREYLTAPAESLHRLSKDITTAEGVIVYPLARSLGAANRAGVRPGERVAVLGLGPLGLLCVATADAAGAEEILAVDGVARRIEVAELMGATSTVNIAEEGPRGFSAPGRFGDWAEVTFQCGGLEDSVGLSIDLTAPGGRVVWMGLDEPSTEVPVVKALTKQLTVYGSFRPANVHPRAIRLLDTGRIDPMPLITHRFEFPEVEEALQYVLSHGDTVVKALMDMVPEED